MSITSRAAGGSRLLSLALFGLLLASGCRSSTSAGDPAGKVEHAPENAPVTLSLGPSTLDSFGVDSGASCSDAGPPVTGLDGGASCGATLAASTFPYAICSCGSLQSTGVMTTDGYDSTKGGPTGALGANVGFNASAAWGSAPSLGGNLFSPGGISAPKGGLVRGDLHLGGAVAGGGQTFTVDGNAFVEATLPSSVKVLGTTTHVSSVASPCNCGSPLPISSLVSAHAAPNNEDSAIGLSASAAGGGNSSQIDLPCGDFYLTVISPSKPLTIAAHGHTELYIAGAVSASNALTFSIDPGASLDLFVAGGFSATSTLNLGSVASPSSCRVYVAGSQFAVPSSASIACNIYAPSASIGLPSTTAYGAIYANGVTASGSATLHYDTSIENGTCATCTAGSCDDGNPCTVDSCNSNGTCSHTNAVNGTSCPIGANLCDQSYTCQAGACTGSNPVVCAAEDQCHGVGTCNQSTGVCSNPALANGTACNDGNACTQSDSCQAGVCTGSNPVTCTAEDQCHSAGTCNPANGTCSNPALANGTACNDGNACTLSDSCQAGVCTGSNPVVCTASDQCHTAGACNPSTGTCSNPAASNGTACNDGNACTLSDSCQSGTCTGSNLVVCTAQDACHAVGTCNTTTGTCSNPTAPDGTSCTGTNLCNQAYACASGVCTGSNPVTCTALDACHVAGQCQSSTGTCTNPTAPNGTTCDDGNLCTANDVCTGGACAGSPVTCTPLDGCHLAGQCQQSSGVCTNPTAPDGTACTSSNLCNQSYACASGACTGSDPVVCEQLDVCHTSGTCNPATGICSNVPISQCADVDMTVASTIFATSAFLYSGSNPSQTGVTAGTIVPERAAVLRGRVLDRSGSPIAGAVATIVGHPEFGSTETLADGTYTMAVNGGAPLTVNVAASGYLPVQRTLPTPWNDYVLAPDIVVTALDTASTPVTLGASGYQVARATTVTDSDGTRTATLLFPPGTTAVLETGTGTSPISSLTVRATEYTVGATGPLALPGELPPSSGYTYAAEFTADEELVYGPAASVQFASPILSYTDNFLQFTAGQRVPVGSYNRSTAQWVPSPDGLVIAIVSISGGVANIDITGDGVGDSAAALAAVGITPAEQSELATLYPAPTSLWRVPIPHFSQPWDFNWPIGFPDGAAPPPGPVAGSPAAPDCKLMCCGGGDGSSGGGSGGSSGGPDSNSSSNASTIECQNGILHESIPVAGTPFSLAYTSDRVVGYAANNREIIPLAGPSGPPSSVVQMSLEVDVAGRTFTQTFAPPFSANQSTTFDWDGNDAFGRAVQGTQVASVSVGYVYNGVYQSSNPNLTGAQYNATFGHFSYFGTPATGDRTRQQVSLLENSAAPIGHWLNEPLGLGGWSLSVHHAYDIGSHSLLFGDGTRRSTTALGNVVTTIAGDGGQVPGKGLNGPAINADIADAEPTVGPDGTVYIGQGAIDFSSSNSHCITKIDSNGILRPFAGQCASAGCDGDGGQAINAHITAPAANSIGPDGSLYIADFVCGNVRKVAPNGIITTVAGPSNGSGVGYSGDAGPATSALFRNVNSVSVASDGTVYIADYNNCALRGVTPDNIIRTVAGGLGCGISGTGGPAGKAQVQIGVVRVAPDDSIYLVEYAANVIRRIGPDGVIRVFAGTGSSTESGDGGQAVNAGIFFPLDMAFGRDGSAYISDKSCVIRRVGPDGVISTFAGQAGQCGFSGDNGPPQDARFGQPNMSNTVGPNLISMGPDGSLYVSDRVNGRLRRISPPLPGFGQGAGTIQAASGDGKRVFVFDGNGRHLSTSDAITGATLFSFAYNGSGQLATVTDVNGDVTTVNRDPSGTFTGITSPFGVTTTASLGGDGYLATVTDPTGALYQMAYAKGLLTTIQFPTGSKTAESTKTYDSLGRIATSTDAAGGGLTIARASDSLSSVGVTKTTTMGVPTGYAIASSPSTTTLSPDRPSVWTNNLPGASNPAVMQMNPDNSSSVTSPDGTQTSTTVVPDPRFGVLALLPQTIVELPSGLTSTTTVSRSVTLNSSGALTAQTDTSIVNSHTWTRAFAAGPPATWTTTSPVGRTSSMTIDTAGRPLTTSVPNVAPFLFQYDSHGRLQQTTQGTRTWLTGYDANGYASSQTDPLSHTVSTLNDQDGRPLTTTLQDLREVGTSWDGDGNMLNITLPGALATQPDPSREHKFSFTPVDLTQTYTPPAIGVGLPSTSYSYDADRFLTSITRPDGIVVTHVPDAFERLSQVQYPQGALSYGYSPTTGQLLTTTTPAGETTTFAYDGFLQKSVTWSGPIAGSIAFGYNSDFHVTSQSLNAGTALPFGYDADGLLTCAGASTCPASGALGLTLDLHNGRLNATALGSVADVYGYDPNGLLASYASTFSGSSALYAETIVSRDLNGRITEKTDVLAGTSHDWKYVYDVAGRLTDVTEDGNFEAHYSYDGDDNRTTFTNASGAVNPTYDVQDRLSTYGSTGYAFTANGELTSKTAGGQVTSYTYDALGNLLHVGLPAALPDGAQTIDYIVDGQNRRVGRVVNGTLVQGWLYQDQLRPEAQLDGSGTNVVARFVYGSKANVPDYMVTLNSSGTVLGTYRILSDHLGSPRLVVDANSGNLIETINFDEFGNETDMLAGTLPTGYVRIPFGFAGGLYDPDTGLVRFGARDYDASVGRWTAKDPVRFGGRQLNFYAYSANDPINERDPTGKNDACDFACNTAVTLACTAACAEVTGPALYWCALRCGTTGWAWCKGICYEPPTPNPTPSCPSAPPPPCDPSTQNCNYCDPATATCGPEPEPFPSWRDPTPE